MQRAELELWRARDVARLLALVQGERRYFQEILGDLPVGVAVVSRDMTLASANRRFRSMFGLPATGASVEPIDRLVPLPELTARLQSVFADAAAAGSFQTSLPGDANAAPVRVTVQPCRDWDEATDSEVCVVVEDLGAAAVAQPEVAVAPAAAVEPAGPSVAEFARRIETVPGILWEVDADTMRFRWVSENAVRELKLLDDVWREDANFWARGVLPADLPRLKAFYQLTLDATGVRSCEYRAVSGKGEVLWLRDIVRVDRSQASGAVSLHGLTVDTSHEKRREESRAQADRVAAVGRLAERVVHDCNNLVMVTSGFAEDLLSAVPATHPLRANVHQIIAAGKRVSALTEQLGSFLNRPLATPRVFVLDSLLKELRPELESAVTRGVEFVIDLQAGDTAVRADAALVTEALRALVSRAAEAIPNGGTITIRTSTVDIPESSTAGGTVAAGPYARIDVWDTGHPIQGDLLAHLFEPAVLSEPPKHNLPVLYQTIRDMGGDLLATSDPDRGTLFSVYLPCAPQADALPHEVPTPPEPEAAVRRAQTVLVVEDEVGIRALLNKVLVRQGYTVLEAANGREALEVARSHAGPIHLLISDVVMPEMGGVELANQLRPQRPETKVLLISGYMGAPGPASLPRGAAFLQKPFTLNALSIKVKEMLENKRDT